MHSKLCESRVLTVKVYTRLCTLTIKVKSVHRVMYTYCNFYIGTANKISPTMYSQFWCISKSLAGVEAEDAAAVEQFGNLIPWVIGQAKNFAAVGEKVLLFSCLALAALLLRLTWSVIHEVQ